MPGFDRESGPASLRYQGRPASLDVKGQQLELFPFDAFTYDRETQTVVLAPGWTISGINTTELFSESLTVNSGGELKSENYVAGSAGWKLDSAGNLEANDGTFRGELDGSTGTFSGNLSAAGGTFTGSLDGVNGTFTGALQGGTISIGSGKFSVDSAGNLQTTDATVTNQLKLKASDTSDIFQIDTQGTNIGFAFAMTPWGGEKVGVRFIQSDGTVVFRYFMLYS